MSKPLTDEQRLDHKETLNSRFTLSIEEQQELLASEEAGWKEAEKWQAEALKQHPTQDAYDHACKALWIHRGNSEMLRKEVWKLEEKLQNAINALAWYANEDNYVVDWIDEMQSQVESDGGKIAANAIKQIQEGDCS